MRHELDSSPCDPLEVRPPRLPGEIGAVVEVSADASGQLPAELIAFAYRASRRAPVVLVCEGATRAAVNAVLDPTVQEVGVDVFGVRYVDGEDEAGVRQAVHAAPLVVASSERLRALLRAWGVPFVEAREAAGRLLSWSEDHGAA